MDNEPPIDPAALERIHKIGGAKLVGKIIALFLENAPQRLEAARQGERSGDLAAVEQAVHSLKSSAGNVGATRLQELAATIEELAEKGEADPLPGLLVELEDALSGAVRCLAEHQKGLEA